MVRKRTKIVATISDKNCEPDFIRQLFEEGMDVVRINSAHLDTDGALRIIKNVREVSDKIAILIDTKGPEIRTTVCDNPITIKKGKTIRMVGDPEQKSSPETLFVSLRGFVEEIPIGALVMIDDGEIELKAVRKEGDTLICRAENDGIIGSRKSVNIPGVKIDLPSLTDKDRIFIKMAAEND
ncbi:MAG: pyk, partial [Bacteroidetes bacterium]|nr:pyk [Bacteroidota bacterium]